MAFSFTMGGAYKTVATAEQALQLLNMGWTYVSGSADDTTALGEFPSYLEDFGGAPSNPTFRGDGFNGELQTNLGYLIKKVQPSLSKDDYDAIKDAFYNDESKTASTFTSIVVVDELPDEPDEVTICLLLDGDGDPADGLYISNAGDWIAYAPGDEFDVNYGSTRELALVTLATSAEVPNGTTNDKSHINTALCALAEACEGFDDTNYDVTVLAGASNTYNSGTGAWEGKFVVTHKTNAADTTTDAAARQITVTIASS